MCLQCREDSTSKWLYGENSGNDSHIYRSDPRESCVHSEWPHTGLYGDSKENGLKYSSVNRGFPAGNPIANIFVIIVGALAISASIVLGFFAFVIVGSIVLIMASIIGLRVWWLNRKMRGRKPPGGETGSPSHGGVIEGEYRVVAGDGEDE